MKSTVNFQNPPEWFHIAVACPRLGHGLYANLYRFGAVKGPRPLLVYIGGSINAQTYVARADGEPEPVLKQLQVATDQQGLAAHDFLVCPNPPRGWETGSVNRDFFRHFQQDLLQEVGAAPSTIGLIGYSAGGSVATYVALHDKRASALALVGAADPAAAAEPPPETETSSTEEEADQDEGLDARAWEAIKERLRCESYRNVGDPSDPALAGVEKLQELIPVRAVIIGSAPEKEMPVDGHPFRKYAKANAVSSAFRFALKRMNRVHLGLGD